MQLLNETRDRYNRIVKVGDYVRFTSFMGEKLAGVVSIISEKNIGIRRGVLQYDRLHKNVVKITEEQYMLYQLESE